MKKKNIYDLALMKIKQEETKVEMILKEKNNMKKDLQKILDRYNELNTRLVKEMEEEKRISPSIIFLNKQMDYSEKQRIINQIKRIENEVLLFKREYLHIKTRKERVVEKKELKDKELEESKSKKEFLDTQNVFLSKRYLERGDDSFES